MPHERTFFIMSELSIRPVSEHDAEEIARLDQRLTQQWRIEHWEDRITYAARRDPEGSLVALAGGKLVGYLFSDVRGQEYGFAEQTGWLEAVGVDPEHQGQSIGRQLLEQVMQRLSQNGVSDVRTLVSTRHAELATFFEHLGFEVEPIQVLGRKTVAAPSLVPRR
jgi:predicted N-acetyltransferase YhbS